MEKRLIYRSIDRKMDSLGTTNHLTHLIIDLGAQVRQRLLGDTVLDVAVECLKDLKHILEGGVEERGLLLDMVTKLLRRLFLLLEFFALVPVL